MPFILATIFSILIGFHLLAESTFQKNLTHISEKIESISPCVLVIFGATGDLTARKLIPAIYHLVHEGHLPTNTTVVGVARGDYTHESFRDKIEHSIQHFSKDPIFWKQFKQQIFYHQSSFEDEQGYEKLKHVLNQIDQELGTQGNRIYYLATQPSYFSSIISCLKKNHLIYEKDEKAWSRVIIEKPFGRDLNSAVQLQQDISSHLDESQIYRMDHYLAKEGVQNLLAFRFQNNLFEALWNHHYIDHVQITLAEEIGIGSRANLWEECGALRDLLQNHLLQLLAIVAMEPPKEDIHEEKVRVLNAIRPFNDIEKEVIRGQYGTGLIQGEKVCGYREEKGIPFLSYIDTFVAMKLFIDNERWQGVPFYVRGGKRLLQQVTEIAITFKKNVFMQDANVLFIRIQPHAGIFLKTCSKVPALQHDLKPVVFGYRPDKVFNVSSPEAYEKMIFDCINGKNHLFVSAEEQIAAWRLLTPVLKYWQTHTKENFPNYEAGTWGPAEQLFFEQGHQWSLLEE